MADGGIYQYSSIGCCFPAYRKWRGFSDIFSCISSDIIMYESAARGRVHFRDVGDWRIGIDARDKHKAHSQPRRPGLNETEVILATPGTARHGTAQSDGAGEVRSESDRPQTVGMHDWHASAMSPDAVQCAAVPALPYIQWRAWDRLKFSKLRFGQHNLYVVKSLNSTHQITFEPGSRVHTALYCSPQRVMIRRPH